MRKKSLQNMLQRVTQEMYKRNFELAETNKILSMLRAIDELALQSHGSLEEFSENMSGAIAAQGDFSLVGLMLHRHGRTKEYNLSGYSSSAAISEEVKDILSHLTLNGSAEEFEPENKIQVFDNKEIDVAFRRLFGLNKKAINVLEEFQSGTLFLVKLMARQRLVGILVVASSNHKKEINSAEQKLLERLSEAVGVAIDNKLLFEENQRIVNQLKKTNEKLQALDEAKDEFISMASHQLRTPLTSVKGYLSMVLEGDAGKLTSSQKKLLDQAFISSQRMVFLIADLLNVSRLKTGKFLIEVKPTDLAQVVLQEVEQLKETAEGRGLILEYKKPKNFPMLMLDETKIRQVVMNFMDNAIYYTPSGGHITVNLVERPESIEFTVVDNGLGVPKAEQQHLFTKFYRAGNAKKARPDGTGLGLFMAKKVVIAQNGAIIFKSQEGKGSTFGFSFARAKLKPLTATAALKK